MNLNEIYKKEKIINSHFRRKYNYDNEEIFNKQVLELLCELSEFAYETKCFKYWKNEKQSSPDITIPEFADCLMITLCFCDLANIDEINAYLENVKQDCLLIDLASNPGGIDKKAAKEIPVFLENTINYLEVMLAANPEVVGYLRSIKIPQIDWQKTIQDIFGFLQNGMGNVLTSTFSVASNIASGAVNFFIAFPEGKIGEPI